MKLLSQRDQRWAKKKLGNSNLTIGDYGCVITSLAMMLDTTPDKINEYLKKHGGFQGALVVWDKVPGFVKVGWQYNNAAVLAAIKKYGACMVRTDFDGNPRTDGDHYVVFIGNHKLLDPWTGTERPTSAYPLLKGYIVIDIEKGKKIMKGDDTDPLQECLKQHAYLMGLLAKKDKELDKIKKQLGNCQQGLQNSDSVRKDLEKSNKELLAKNRENAQLAEDYHLKLIRTNKKIDSLSAELEKTKEERQDYKRRYEAALKSRVNNQSWWQLLVYAISRIWRRS